MTVLQQSMTPPHGSPTTSMQRLLSVDAPKPVVTYRAATLSSLVPALVLLLLLAVLSMHQLSRNHTLVVSAADSAHSVSSKQESLTDDHSGPVGSSAPEVHASDSCQGSCSNHAAMWAACILALTLLVFNWWLRRPGRHPQPLGRLWRDRRTRPVQRRIPCLSLVELSLRRT